MDKETFRKYLIKNASPAELKMLEALRFDEELNNKFEFQKIFHPYIVDFYIY